MTPEQKRLRARLGGLTRSAMYDGAEMTAKARASFLDKFYNETPDDLPEAERQRRADAALRAHMARLAYASSKARRRSA